MQLTPTSEVGSAEEQQEIYKTRSQEIEKKIQRVQLCIDTLEAGNDKWLEYSQNQPLKNEEMLRKRNMMRLQKKTRDIPKTIKIAGKPAFLL
ncbi:unnamed protein product [Onchocerca flexuosa]|uniref:Coiled-coil domain-containing protein 169 n=1 Tax=Onchocerca flexuosa TaxID=387005 RepID=A0A183I6D9_9BILA|nr:unnamed protein product [Onchocerca flexuosa]